MDHLSGHEGEIPLPISSTYVVHHPCSTRPLSSTIINNSSTTEDSNNNNNNNNNRKQLVVVANNNKSTSAAVRYRECLKNHAASMGGTATDGCGEFMPSGEEGSLEALKCSACSCHRNFHRKEVEGEAEPPSSYYHELYHYYKPTTRYLPTTTRPQHPPALIMPLGAIHTSESDEMEDVGYGGFGGEMMRAHQSQSQGFDVKKRFRTKFTQEQKEKMLGFAERVGWKLQRTEEGSVQQFCQEIGIKRRVLKVWMHNNKHNLQAKMKTNTTTSDTVTTAAD